MVDQSYLDDKYFIDTSIYNCPFCNRRHVSYHVASKRTFDWTTKKNCYVYFVKCHSCQNISMHLSYQDLRIYKYGNYGQDAAFRFDLGPDCVKKLDEKFFYSVPTSFFVLDNRIPKILRELMTEAEGCLKSNYLTGGSACARKLIYELGVLQNAIGDTYEDRIKSLKNINKDVDSAYFDTLLTIQQVTSTKVHEKAYDGWESKHLRLILSSLLEILNEIYVVPAVRDDKRKTILKLKKEIFGTNTPGEASKKNKGQ